MNLHGNRLARARVWFASELLREEDLHRPAVGDNLGFPRTTVARVSIFAGKGTYCGTWQGPRYLPMVVFRVEWMHLDLDWIVSWDANTRKCILKRLGSNPIEYPRVAVDWVACPSFGRWGCSKYGFSGLPNHI
jgi:hypothetical protein